MNKSSNKFSSLIEKFKNKDRTALAKIITIVESTGSSRKEADIILRELSRENKKTIRIAISGPPGVGKSTFINRLGKKLIEKNYDVAILAIDPSSDMTEGSILADKTRMKDIISSEQVFIRPSPSKGSLGGVALATSDVIFVVEAFGFDVVVIETVGVGQSETIAHTLVDHFVVLIQPGSGDQLQAMKKGILEKADFILVNKADEEQISLAKKTNNSLHALKTRIYIARVSALTDIGIDDFLDALLARHQSLIASRQLEIIRRKNCERFLQFAFNELIAQRLWTMPNIADSCQKILKESICNDSSLSPALNRLMDEICHKL